MPKRDYTPPYEIMRGSSNAPQGDASDSTASSQHATDPPSTPTAKAPWWVGSSSPIVLRLPKGLAVLAVVGLLLLIVVAYSVGSARGAASAKPELVQAIGERTGPAGWFEAEDDAYEGPVERPPEKVILDERREPGLWYLRLMTSTPEDCRRLAEFMHSRGVAIQLVMRDNGRSVAYAIDRGYRTDEKDSEAAQHYLGWMRQRGREWKLRNGGRGDDLSSMFYAQYRSK